MYDCPKCAFKTKTLLGMYGHCKLHDMKPTDVMALVAQGKIKDDGVY